MTIKKVINLSHIICLIMIFSFVKPMVTNAEEGGIGFSVSPILPKTQIDRELGYYYLETKPSEEQTFEVKLASQKEDKQIIEMFVEDAYTGTTGNLTYGIDGKDGFKQDKTLKDATSQIVMPTSKTVELEPGEQKVVTFKIIPPKESYEGVKVGRLVFKAANDENKKAAVVEDYQYGVSIILAENGDSYNDGDLQNIELNEVKATVKRGKRLVTANLHNPISKRILNLNLQATVTKKGNDKVIKQTKIPEFQFAPNSNVDLEVDWGLSELAAGEYTMTISAENEYDKIHLTKNFKITNELATKLNKESAFKIATPMWVKISTIISGVMTVGLSIFLISRNKKWLEASKKKRQNSRKKRQKKK